MKGPDGEKGIDKKNIQSVKTKAARPNISFFSFFTREQCDQIGRNFGIWGKVSLIYQQSQKSKVSNN
jgi:hypothetical protein